jgi:hypothetical protein
MPLKEPELYNFDRAIDKIVNLSFDIHENLRSCGEPMTYRWAVLKRLTNALKLHSRMANTERRVIELKMKEEKNKP